MSLSKYCKEVLIDAMTVEAAALELAAAVDSLHAISAAEDVAAIGALPHVVPAVIGALPHVMPAAIGALVGVPGSLGAAAAKADLDTVQAKVDGLITAAAAAADATTIQAKVDAALAALAAKADLTTVQAKVDAILASLKAASIMA